MTAAYEACDRSMVRQLVEQSGYLDEMEQSKLNACLTISHQVFIGLVDGKYACCWGLIPKSLMSDRAYLWLQTTPLVEERKFLFVRHSQRWVEQSLKDYGEIVGFCRPENALAIRWIEWLGGEFQRPFGIRADFVIRRRHG